MRPASAWWSITGGPTIAGSRGSIHTGDARKAIELRQFSFGNSPQMRDSSSVVIGKSDSHTAAWKASGTTSGEAASMARMPSASRLRPCGDDAAAAPVVRR
jgi:hypothetical protein